MSELSRTLHPMTVGDILDRSIQLYRGNFLKFVGIVLLVKGPYLIFGYVLIEFMEFLFAEVPYIPSIALILVRLLELLFIGPVLIAAMTMAISERFLNRDIGITEAYKKILKRFFPLLGTILLMATVIFSVILGIILMSIAGAQLGPIMFVIGAILVIVLFIWYAFIAQTVVIEGEGGISAMKRSKYLVKGNFLKAFALIILIFIAVALVTGVISFAIMRVLFFLGEYGNLLAEGASNVVSVFLEPFRIAAITLLYYDFRIRKEGFDLEMMAEELEADIGDDYDV